MGALKSVPFVINLFSLFKLQKFCWSILRQLTLLSCIFYYWDYSVRFPTLHILYYSYPNFPFDFFLVVSFSLMKSTIDFLFLFLNFMFVSLYCPLSLACWFWSARLCIIQRLVWDLYRWFKCQFCVQRPHDDVCISPMLCS